MRFGALGFVLLLTASCGSTVANSGPTAVQQSSGNVQASTQPQPFASVIGVGGTTVPSLVSGSAGADTGATATRPGSVAGGKIAITATEITLGIEVTTNLGPLYSAIGANASGASPQDQQKAGQIIVNYINRHGGFGGRKATTVFETSDYTSGQWASQAEASCAGFTQDHHVYAVIGGLNGVHALPKCLAKARTPLFTDMAYPYDKTDMSQLADYLYMPSSMNASRAAQNYIDSLFRLGYFSKGAKIGLLRHDQPMYKRVTDETIKPALAAHGLKLTSEIAVSEPNSLSDFGSLSAQLNNAILQFRTAMVDHVIWEDFNGVIPFFFLPQAEGQHYRPRYGFHSQQQPALQTGTAPSAQLAGSIGLGWSPILDHPPANESGFTGMTKFCDKILRAGGVADGALGRGLQFCESLFLVKGALDRTPRQISIKSLRAAVESITHYEPTYSPSAHFGPGRHDGPDQVRNIAYDAGCNCFQYTSPPRAAL